MKAKNIFITRTCLLMLILGTHQSIDAQQNIVQETYAILRPVALIVTDNLGRMQTIL